MADLTFLHARHFPRCEAVVDKRYPDYCALQMITGGSIDLSYDQRRYRLSGRWLFLSWPGPWTHFERSPGRAYWVHRYVAFKGPLMAKWFEAGLLPFEPQRVPTRTDFVARFDRMLEVFARTDRVGHLRAVNLLEGMLLELADQRRPAEVQWLDRARSLLGRGGRVDYPAIAAEMGMGLSTFRRRFRDEAGMSVHRFMLNRRIEAAKYLLEETQLPIKAIARQLGYRDVFFFSRQFGKLARSSPGKYRSERQSGAEPG